MKLTKQQLKQLVKEELATVLKENIQLIRDGEFSNGTTWEEHSNGIFYLDRYDEDEQREVSVGAPIEELRLELGETPEEEKLTSYVPLEEDGDSDEWEGRWDPETGLRIK